MLWIHNNNKSSLFCICCFGFVTDMFRLFLLHCLWVFYMIKGPEHETLQERVFGETRSRFRWSLPESQSILDGRLVTPPSVSSSVSGNEWIGNWCNRWRGCCQLIVGAVKKNIWFPAPFSGKQLGKTSPDCRLTGPSNLWLLADVSLRHWFL